MMFKSLCAGALVLGSVFASPQASGAAAISSQVVGEPTRAAASFVQSNVPTGRPVPGNYTGKYRPQVHFSPPAGFMNDPNGMFVDVNGVWHLYYQYNPTANVAGNQHWGHATSTDLYHWVNQPIALFPPNNFTYVFSGSAVVDVNNTSGFFPNQRNGVVAIYTLAEYPGGVAGPQQQAIAYSYDNGYTFIPYSGNPVIRSTSSQFRDPKVIWSHGRWVMVIAYAQEFTIGFFTSPDLKNWTFASNFTNHGLLGLQYECPNLVQMPVRGSSESMYLLTISINPGAPLGGSIAEYFPGRFNGTHFTAVDAAARVADFGKDNYAGQFFYGTPAGQDAVSIAWASNWQYTQIAPTASEGWRSVMSLPRRNYLVNATRIGYVMASEPYDLSPVRGPLLASNSSLGNGTLFLDYSSVASNALYFEITASNLAGKSISGSATVNFTFTSPVTREYLEGGFYFGGDNPFFLNRGGVRGFDNVFFTDKFSQTTLVNSTGTWSVSGVIDRSILEVFIDGGQFSATNTYFPVEALTEMTVGANDLPAGVVLSVRVHALESAWTGYRNSAGTVVGNVTSSMGRNGTMG